MTHAQATFVNRYFPIGAVIRVVGSIVYLSINWQDAVRLDIIASILRMNGTRFAAAYGLTAKGLRTFRIAGALARRYVPVGDIDVQAKRRETMKSKGQVSVADLSAYYASKAPGARPYDNEWRTIADARVLRVRGLTFVFDRTPGTHPDLHSDVLRSAGILN